MQSEITFPGWLRNALIGLGLFVAGGAIAFGYSYRPLHGALSWKVAHLETRLDERNLELQGLQDQLQSLKSTEEERVDPETLSQIESELEKTRTALASLEKKNATAEQKRKDANASARTWRKRFESLEKAQRETVPAAPVAALAPVPVPENFVRPAPSPVAADRANDFSATPGPDRSSSSPAAQSGTFPEATLRPSPTQTPTQKRSAPTPRLDGPTPSPAGTESGILSGSAPSATP